MIPEEIKGIAVVTALESAIPQALLQGQRVGGELTLEVAPDRNVEVCTFLKEKQQFSRLSSITAVDWHPAVARYEVVYHIHSLERNERLRLKCRLDGDTAEVDSLCGVWRAANWYEREVFDLFGIIFRGHPNLRRLLMPEDWVGHPLRKDYPAHGQKYSYPDQLGS